MRRDFATESRNEWLRDEQKQADDLRLSAKFALGVGIGLLLGMLFLLCSCSASISIGQSECVDAELQKMSDDASLDGLTVGDREAFEKMLNDGGSYVQ